MIAYNFGSEYYKEPGSFAINAVEQVMEKLGFCEILPGNYEDYPITNMDTTLIAYNPYTYSTKTTTTVGNGKANNS